MSRFLVSFAVAGLTLVVGGCDSPFEYYPHHEQPMVAGDNEKAGTGSYAGTNSTYNNTVTPGSPAATNQAAGNPRSAVEPGEGHEGSPINSGSYSGAGVGGGNLGGTTPNTPADGTISIGGSSGR